MKTVIIKAIAKVTNTNVKTAHVPFYKGIMTIPTAPTVKDVYNFILRYTVEMYPAVKPYGEAFLRAAKRLWTDLENFEKRGILDAYAVDTLVYKFLWLFFCEVKKDYPWTAENGLGIALTRHMVIVHLANAYFDRYFQSTID